MTSIAGRISIQTSKSMKMRALGWMVPLGGNYEFTLQALKELTYLLATFGFCSTFCIQATPGLAPRLSAGRLKARSRVTPINLRMGALAGPKVGSTLG